MALLEPVDLRNIENALFPTNDTERLLFRNLFHNLIGLDCQQTIRPGLAESWTADSGGRVWTFTLREGVSIQPGWLKTEEAPGIDSAFMLDERHLRVSVRRADSTPSQFADPSLAVVTGMVPRGEGHVAIPAKGGLPVVSFQFLPKTDPRDALDRGADLIVTRDPALVEYARGLPEFTTFPLAWSRTYALLQPPGADPVDAASAESERRSLAQDAVRADARVAEPPFWSNELEVCADRRPGPGTTLASSRIVYTRGDEVARGLAERKVALQGPAAGLITEPLDPAEFTARLRSGSERAYVLALPRRTLAPCREAAALPYGATIQPLIDTRAYAVVRKGAPPLWSEWDGTVRVAEP